MRILIATRNRHKLGEIRAILNQPDIEWVDLSAFPGAPAVEEDLPTFEGNAVKKAVELARFSGLWTLADDSGLEVDALGGDPGVRSARYAGEPADDAANNRKLLAALDGHTDRAACFRCVVALTHPEGSCRWVEGRCEGHIVDAPRGAGGFGYDPLFIPRGFTQTYAELSPAVKNRISHRARALQRAADELLPWYKLQTA
jgi:XTP/dITP diphosphohydrolase